MSNQSLPGNPFVGEPDGDGVIDAVVFSADDSPMQTTELLLDNLKNATLALAHEQRTATLASVHQHAQRLWVERKADSLDAGSEEKFLAQMNELSEMIDSRLGLGGDAS